jgi:hypothetical protein
LHLTRFADTGERSLWSGANFQAITFDFAQLDRWSIVKPGRPQTEVHADVRPDEAFSLVDFQRFSCGFDGKWEDASCWE